MVDDNARGKMDEFFLAWHTGSPTGKELLGLGPQIAVEQGIRGEQAVSLIFLVTFNLLMHFSDLVR